MTVGALARRRRHDARIAWTPVVAACAGCVALAARPPLTWVAFGVTIAVGVAGALATAVRDPRAPALAAGVVTIGGIAAFASVRLVVAIPPSPATLRTATMVVAAAVAEELFFRRFLYGALAGWGAAAAVAGSAIAFALVHIPAYGTAVFPVDLAAGLVLSWQRWATGSWTASAVTHAAANLMAIL